MCEKTMEWGSWSGYRALSRLNWPLEFHSEVMLLKLRNALLSLLCLMSKNNQFSVMQLL